MQVTVTQCDGSGPGRHQMHRGPMSEVKFESNQRLPKGRQAKRRKFGMKRVMSLTSTMRGMARLVDRWVSRHVGCRMIRTTSCQYRNKRWYNIGDRWRREGGCRIPGLSRNSVTTWVRAADGIDHRRHYGIVGSALYWSSRSAVRNSFVVERRRMEGRGNWGEALQQVRHLMRWLLICRVRNLIRKNLSSEARLSKVKRR